MDYEFLAYLEQFVRPERKALFEKMLDLRTRHITVGSENVYQSQNSSAIIRSCDCFGIQDVHIIENCYDFYISPDVDMGSSKWLNIFHYNDKKNNTENCIKTLQKKGYQIVATTPHYSNVSLHNLPLEQPLALIFGTEKEGLTEAALDLSDIKMRIPMYGFTESFNVSVSAALSLQSIRRRLEESRIKWQLSKIERDEIYLEWCKKSVRKPEILERNFYENRKQDC